MPKKADEKTIERLLGRGIEEVIVREHLVNDLRKGTPLRIKLGADPTAPDLHLGHAVVLRKLREFQELGHTVVFIIGDYTALIGDPSGKSKTRPQLDPKTIAANAKTYFAQVGKILDLKKTEVRYNSEWFKNMSVADLICLMSQFSSQRILERDDFNKRIKEGVEVAVHEQLYPIMQAQDSVSTKASVEIGGTDQKFNMLAGRELQKKMGMLPQDVVTCPLLIGTDSEKKMSKSLGNYIGLTDAPADMYGKVMSISDKLIIHYFELATELPKDEIAKISNELRTKSNPRDIKAKLAKEIVKMYHGGKAADASEQEFNNVYRDKKVPTLIPTRKISNKYQKINILELLVMVKLASSKSDARRLVEQGGINIDENIIRDINFEVTINQRNGVLVQKGRKTFFRVII